MTVTGTDFVTVFVRDYPAAKEFYGGLLGLESSVDYDRTPGGEFETGNLTLQVMDAEAIGREFEPAPTRSLPRRGPRGGKGRPRGKGRRLPRRHDRQRRLPHGDLQRP